MTDTVKILSKGWVSAGAPGRGRLESQADSFLKVWGDRYLAGDLGTQLNCVEVESLAALLAALGDNEAAEGWISSHAEGDDCGDSHCLCAECVNEIKEV